MGGSEIRLILVVERGERCRGGKNVNTITRVSESFYIHLVSKGAGAGVLPQCL